MDLLIILLLVVVGGMVAGAAIYVPREIRRGGAARGLPPATGPGGLAPLRTELEARYEAEVEKLRGESRRVIGEVETELGRLRETLRSSAHEQESQIVRLRERYAEADDQTLQSLDQALRDLRTHHDAELGRLREAVGAALAAIAARQRSPEAIRLATRRAEALGELHGKVAKIETAFASVANPVLLPGEALKLPPALPPEAYRWESWKEVGDAAFAFAESFAERRIDLDDATCRDLTAFVADLRDQLTGVIYPTLRSGQLTPDGQQTVRRALDQLAAEVTRARESLERAYREPAVDSQ